MFCSHVTEEVFGCDGFSVPCFYKLMCADNLVCNAWKDEFCGNQTDSSSLLEVDQAAQTDDWILESLGFNHNFGSRTQQMAVEMSKRAKRITAYDIHFSKTDDEVDEAGLDASIEGKCTR
jgi:hypothetical protein